MPRRHVALILLALAPVVLLAPGCPGKRRARDRGDTVERYGIYRGTLVEPAGEARSFKLLLFAASPDRLHAEVLPPVGGPKLILDAGGGWLAVTLPGRSKAWAGPADEAVLDAILGFPVSLEGLVAALLEGEPVGGPVSFVRTPSRGAGLPTAVSLEHGGRRLDLELQRTRKRRDSADPIGTGTPPQGVEVRTLDALVDEASEAGPLVLSEP